MSNGPNHLPPNLSIVKPHILDSGLYLPNLYLSNLYSLKNPIQNAPICPIYLNKIKKRFGKYLKTRRKGLIS
jgi:hypothetical protein